MTCKYCGTNLTNVQAKVCKLRECRNKGKLERLRQRQKLNPEAFVGRPHQPIGDDGPAELAYLDSDPGITLDDWNGIHRTPEIRHRAQISRQARQQKLIVRLREVGIYDKADPP